MVIIVGQTPVTDGAEAYLKAMKRHRAKSAGHRGKKI
jgi:hypothetical protein